MDIIYQGKLKKAEFVLAIGDLFETNVDAIVNSEQTDFILAGNPTTISGQIRLRYGSGVQEELDQATGRKVLGPGTVLETSGSQDFTCIFHAGFHAPHDWPGLTRTQDADYLETIGSCIRQVLDSAREKKLSSVAFPLIGCGLFGLDERMLILQFLEAIEAIDERMEMHESLAVWLVIRERSQFDAVVGVLLDLLLRHRSKTVSLQLPKTGVPILDRFGSRLVHPSEEEWAKWLLCRFTEIALGTACFGLCLATNPPRMPETLFVEGAPPTFGTIRHKAIQFATGFSQPTRTAWGARFFSDLLKATTAAHALEIINKQRNYLAHGRKSVPFEQLKQLVIQGLKLNEWARISETDGKLRTEDWIPWLAASSKAGKQIGLFERWQGDTIRYLVPETGELFQMPRKLRGTFSAGRKEI